MKCTFKDSNLLKKIINALSKDLTLVNFKFDINGLKINAMNDSHTDMRDFYLYFTFSNHMSAINRTMIQKCWVLTLVYFKNISTLLDRKMLSSGKQ